MADIHKGYCHGCPFDWGAPGTEAAYNLGCLPSAGEVSARCEAVGKSWACHSEPNKVCCGYAAIHPSRTDLPLMIEIGIHAT